MTLAVVVVLFCGRLTWAAPSAKHSDALISDELGGVVPATVSALEQNVNGATGHDGRYLVSWDDAAYIGSPGYGLLNELDRRGFDVGAIDGLRVIATPHQRLERSRGHRSSRAGHRRMGRRWRAFRVRPRWRSSTTHAAQQTRYAQLRSEVITLLRAHGFDDLVAKVDDNLFGAASTARVAQDADIEPRLSEMLALGVPIGVFIAPPGVHL